jgi:hypothetical protein
MAGTAPIIDSGEYSPEERFIKSRRILLPARTRRLVLRQLELSLVPPLIRI